MDMHEKYMKRALELAKFGWGRTNPNPLVGAVIVKDGKIISEGYHKRLGGDHAEIDAFKNISCDVAGATIYVNLEPCSHQGRTPPCSKAIIEKGIKKVVIAMTDPNPKVKGNGIKMLRDNGVEVTTGVLEDKAKKLNEIFIKYITRKKPFVTMKWAMTLDGKIATKTYDSKWISCDLSREYVHTIRDRMAAIMVGSSTVISDNPSLTTRLKDGGGTNPLRIVVDSKGIVPHDSNVFNNDGAGCILATTSQITKEKIKRLKDKGVLVLMIGREDGHVDLVQLMDELYKMEIDSVLLEGGGGLNAAALDAGIVDKATIFIAPKIIGGREATTPVEGAGIAFMQDAIQLKDMAVKRFDKDIFIEGYVKGDICLQE